MSCNNDSYNNICRQDIPYPQVSPESVPSLISNLVYALYGDITKSVENGRVVWNIPCDPNNTAETENIPREEGEGLLCYLLRVFNNTIDSHSPFLRWGFDGNNGSTFTLSGASNYYSSAYLVYVDGVVQDPITYTVTGSLGNPAILTFTDATIPVGSFLTVVQLQLKGDTGATGATGIGATGASGLVGSTGLVGASGIGATGPVGATGLGATGLVGSTGVDGPVGSSGATGVVGATGATGVGEAGSTGLSGSTGATGLGATGLSGSTGATGLVGSTGIIGPFGSTGSTGLMGPSLTPKGAVNNYFLLPETGNVIGDIYQTNDTGDIYGWDGSEWNNIGPFPIGATGLVGATGLGATGSTGPIGATGLPGQSASFYNYKADAVNISGTPANGRIIWNNLTPQTSSTTVTLSHIDALGNDIDVFFPLFKTGDKFVIQDQGNSANFQTWEISATPTVFLNSYVTIPVTLVTSGGTSQFIDAQNLIFAIVSSGLVGATGATGLGYNLTSNDSIAISTGVKVFTVSNSPSNTAFNVGNRVRVSFNSLNWMEGNITSFSSTSSFTVNVTLTQGSGTYTSWNIDIAGVQGATGEVGATGAVPTNVVTTDTRQTITAEKVIQALYETTSSTSVIIPTQVPVSRTFTGGTGLNWVNGRAVSIKAISSLLTWNMRGSVTSYDSSTGVMVVNVTSTNGSIGISYNDWIITQLSTTALPALRITSNDSAPALLVEDSTNPDSTPFTISSTGRVGIGTTPHSSVCLALDSTGVRFNDGTIQTTAATPNAVTIDTPQTITASKEFKTFYTTTSNSSIDITPDDFYNAGLYVASGLSWMAGDLVRVESSSSLWFEGNVTIYNKSVGFLEVSVTQSAGSGNSTSWNVTPLMTIEPALTLTSTENASIFRVNDQNPDTTPFTISGAGRVGIGVTPDASVGLSLDSTGVKFNDGTVQTTRGIPYSGSSILTGDYTTIDGAFNVVSSVEDNPPAVLINTNGITLDNSELIFTGSNTTANQDLFRLHIRASTIVVGTSVSASGSFIDFINIPNWAKRINIMFDKVRTNGTGITLSNNILIQVGNPSIISNGYTCGVGSGSNAATASSGFMLTYANSATYFSTGIANILKMGDTRWAYSSNSHQDVSNQFSVGAGSINIPANTFIKTIRITTINGTNIFNSGIINISYEG